MGKYLKTGNITFGDTSFVADNDTNHSSMLYNATNVPATCTSNDITFNFYMNFWGDWAAVYMWYGG